MAAPVPKLNLRDSRSVVKGKLRQRCMSRMELGGYGSCWFLPAWGMGGESPRPCDVRVPSGSVRCPVRVGGAHPGAGDGLSGLCGIRASGGLVGPAWKWERDGVRKKSLDRSYGWVYFRTDADRGVPGGLAGDSRCPLRSVGERTCRTADRAGVARVMLSRLQNTCPPGG